MNLLEALFTQDTFLIVFSSSKDTFVADQERRVRLWLMQSLKSKEKENLGNSLTLYARVSNRR